MISIATNTPSTGAEDYEFTQLLKAQEGKSEQDFSLATSLGIVTHLNRATPEPYSYKQVKRWLESGTAIDKIFPEYPYKAESLLKYVQMVVKSRINTAWREWQNNKNQRALDELKQLATDIKQLPDLQKMLGNSSEADILNGVASWGHTKKEI
ncbi:hypothetical protein A2774_00525 [Candidatus Roizmanbacteria bacterium RIFCSPHIGHO2_01_FULL_39_12c]|uniref:Uncharacterized protein n=1 Tax=Candidatus Roizmanbacteria bacterium RIFCSPHIGHO2_01_FULL_39_12c TaxID=1802031 RepID=A0A1F7GAD5_9BACT|nr:MAG: hypothetical protein A2774_00525 [Candidatus Roizmanbacteria bacterium RIFCSPHIGHO2_01_FULL_39_12c]OGK46213.1 MAG: hypothetical protein A2963_01975 [Candidatus Roizmanbacteria bacterium RIFCSPLOWO2_01_FULL_40_13]